jgi:hypothetical protein
MDSDLRIARHSELVSVREDDGTISIEAGWCRSVPAASYDRRAVRPHPARRARNVECKRHVGSLATCAETGLRG